MNNFESQQSPLFNADSFPGAERCIASQHGLPIPVNAAEFPWFADLEQATLALEILDATLTGLRSFTSRQSRGTIYMCGVICRTALNLEAQPCYSTWIMRSISAKLTTYIAVCIAPEDTYGNWLSLQPLDNYQRCPEQTMSARIQWVEWMITCVESNIKQLEENETAACTQQEVYLNTPARWLQTK